MIKRKKHQQWRWTDKTDSAVDRFIEWKSKPHIQKRIFEEHIEIPLRNIIFDYIIKRNIGDNAYLKSESIALIQEFTGFTKDKLKAFESGLIEENASQ